MLGHAGRRVHPTFRKGCLGWGRVADSGAARRQFGYHWKKRELLERKPAVPPADESAASEILEQAALPPDTDKAPRLAKCSVCSGECAPNSTEGLCWVCRRLKISAWRDSDQQMTAQE